MRLVLMYFDEFSVAIELESPSLRESASKVDFNVSFEICKLKI